MTKSIILCATFLSQVVCFSQNHIEFRNVLNEGNYWFYEQNFDSAFYYYEKAEQLNITFYPEEVHLYSRTLWELGDRKKSIQVLTIHEGLKDFFLRDTTYYLGLSSDERVKIATSLKKVEIDLLTDRMPFYDSLIKLDQKYRTVIGYYKQNSIEFDSILRLMYHQDSLNFIGFIQEIKKNGYPGGYLMAPVGLGSIFLHSSPEWLLNNYFVFMKEIQAGRMSFYDFSKGIDRMFVMDEKQRPYNSYLPVEEKDVSSPILVFVNRCSIGMSPYYDVYIPRLYPRGMTPPQSKLYDYYKRSKHNFNCTRIR